MMNLEKRIEQLEHRMGQEGDFLLMVIAAMGCDPGKTGPERVIQHEVAGYSAVGRDRTWTLQPGQSAEHLRALIERELKAEGYKAYAVCECYADNSELTVRA
jgi:hypothetical protein